MYLSVSGRSTWCGVFRSVASSSLLCLITCTVGPSVWRFGDLPLDGSLSHFLSQIEFALSWTPLDRSCSLWALLSIDPSVSRLVVVDCLV